MHKTLKLLFSAPMMERDKFMSADEAKELGLIDEVLTSPPKVGDSTPSTPEWQCAY